MTTRHVPVCFSLALALILGACKPEPYLRISPSNLSFSEDGGTQTVQVSANYPWTVNVSGKGFSVSPSSGEGDGRVTVTASPTDEPDPVSARLTFYCEGLTESVELNQAARNTIMVGNVAKIPAAGGTFEVPVQYNTDFTVEVDADAKSWISFVETKALTSGKLVFDVKENTAFDPRTGKVTVRDKSGKADPLTITLVQEERRVIEVGDVTEIPAEGGTYEVNITYNTEFDVVVEESAKEWIRFVETKALTSGKMVFVFAENVAPDARSGKVTIRDKSGNVSPITLTFVQKEKKIIEVGDVTVIAAEGGTYEVEIAYNTEFTVQVEKSAQSWISFVETKALTSGRLVFVFEENEKPDTRTGKVTIKDKKGKAETVTLTFVQEEKKVIEVGDVAEIPAEGGTYEVAVAYNTDFSVEVDPAAQDWISFVETKALTSGKLVFLFAENTAYDSRSGKVTIRDNNGKAEPVTLTFVQDQKRVIEVGDVTEIPAEGGTYTVDITYSTDFTVQVEKSAQDWISFVETKALTSGQLVFVFEENGKTDPRTGKVTIKDKAGKAETVTLTFVQQEKKVIQVGDVTEIPQEGGTFEIDIQYNTDFWVDIDSGAQSWISFVETKALTSGKLVFVFEENGGVKTRSGVVFIRDNEGKVEPVSLTFVQEGTEPYFRVVCPEAESLDYEAGELVISIEQNVEWYGYGWRNDAEEMLDFDAIRFDWENEYCCKMTIPYTLNTTRKVRSGQIIFYGGEYKNGNYEYTDTLHVYQQPVTIIASEKEVFLPSVASQFSFRVAEDQTDNYRVENDADWIEAVKSQGKKGGAEYVWKAKKNTGTGLREAQIKVYLSGFDEPDVLQVYQEGGELSVSATYSGKRKQVKAPAIFGPFAEKSTIWWGDEASMPYSAGASHTYGTSGSHTISVTTKYMHYIERAEVTDLEDGMHIDFSKMRNHNE